VDRQFFTIRVVCLAVGLASAAIGAAPPATDSLGRENPRSAVTGFLWACQSQDYQKAAQYLDLRRLPAAARERSGADLARRLEGLLNSDPQFNVLRLTQNPEGDPSSADPNRVMVATLVQNGVRHSADLERTNLTNGGPQVWLFSQSTASDLAGFQPSNLAPAIERYLPRFLVAPTFLETPPWKWLALTVLVLLLVSLSRLLDWLLRCLLKIPEKRFQRQWKIPWLGAIIQPLRVMLWLAILRIGLGILDPSAIARLYIGRGMELMFLGSIAWCLIRLVDLLIGHVEARLDARRRMASGALLRLGRRAGNATIVAVALLLVLESWGYNTSALVAGLGVGGIAIALAAQQTIANVFGGVSLIGDQPIRIGEFGKFGDMVGVVEDIGLRSTRVRTLNRTVVSVPNSNFAGLNLENYSARDKILFNPSFQIKRSTTDEQMHGLIKAIGKLLKERPNVESVETPARIVGIAAGYFTLEVFAYVRTADVNEFYGIQSELLLAMNDIFTSSQIELA
jgi:MscS family membrane protein